MKKILLAALLFPLLPVRSEKIILNRWEVKNTTEVPASGETVSGSDFRPEAWYPVTVPSTVLNALVKNGVYPDPRIGMNNFLIPDVSDDFNGRLGLEKYSYLKNGGNPWKDPYWYRTEVVLPKNYKNKKVWLILKGINYRADVWVNGHLVADKNEVAGMFRRFKFDISSYVTAGVKNAVALKIYQVDHPGTPNPGTQFTVFGPPRGHSTDIFKDETLKMSGGWDCAPVVRDRNMGIYQDVLIETTDKVVLENPYVITTLPRKDTTLADIRLKVEVLNTSSEPVKGTLQAEINLINDLEFPTYTRHLEGYLKPIRISVPVMLDGNEMKEVEISSANHPELLVKNPFLWYPNGYGEQYLHHLKLTCRMSGKVSDVKELDFGIREVTSDLKRIGNDYGRVFYINGKRVFCKGGWIQPDILLDNPRKRIFDEARLMAGANINLIGSEDIPAPSEDMVESWDKYGLMYWEVFHQCFRMYPGTVTEHNPVDHQLAAECVKDVVKRYRNNPSIIAWFGANEVIMDENLYNLTKEAVRSLDTTRPYIPTTSTNWDIGGLTPYLNVDLPTGTTDDGAPDYNWCPPEYFFDKVREVHLQMFRNELGIPSIPLYGSLKKFIPTVHETPDLKNPIYPLDSIWAEHGAWDVDNYCYRTYDNAIRALYGSPATVKEYAHRAQLINADGYRAMFEAANHRMWDITTGVMIWKINSCWPDVAWQIYDWYLNPNASYFFSKKAMEPVHIQMSANDFAVSVVNATHKELKDVIVSAKVINDAMRISWSYTDTVMIGKDSYKEFISIPGKGEFTYYYFVKLELKDLSGNILSDNLYWLYSQHQDFSPLGKMRKTNLKQVIDMKDAGKEYHIEVKLKNETDRLSFFNHFILKNPVTDEEILPVFWNDNFVSLFPGEEKVITAVVAKSDAGNQRPVFVIED